MLADKNGMALMRRITRNISYARYVLKVNLQQMLTEMAIKKSGMEDTKNPEIVNTILSLFDAKESDRMTQTWLDMIREGNPDVESLSKKQIAEDAVQFFDTVTIYKNQYLVRSKYRAYLHSALTKEKKS